MAVGEKIVLDPPLAVLIEDQRLVRHLAQQHHDGAGAAGAVDGVGGRGRGRVAAVAAAADCQQGSVARHLVGPGDGQPVLPDRPIDLGG